MREENVQRNSRKRLNALILLVAFTAILLIVATYAWFSTQRNVTLSGLTGVVNVAEGLQISLDAEKWANEIDLSNLAQNYFGVASDYDLENPWEGHYNVIPSELLPVSTTGQSGEGIGQKDLKMYRGDVEGNTLTGIKAVQVDTDPTTPDEPVIPEEGYYAIDLFLQNSSGEDVVTDLLHLQTNSDITLQGNRYSTGLQNTLRVAFAIYDEDAESAQNTEVGSDTATPENIRAATVGTERTISQLAIWEPNASGAQVMDQETPSVIEKYAAHVDYIVANNNNLILPEADYGLLTSGTSVFDADDPVPTYALTNVSATAGTISNIYDWNEGAEAAGLVKQHTLQTPNTGITLEPDAGDGEGLQLVSAANGTAPITLTPGKYIHMKMYVWLEGQDVDCINYASLGGDVTLEIGLSKPAGQTAGAGG